MKNLLSTLCFLFVVVAVQAQDINELSKRNGFKDIKLGTPVDSVKGAVFKKDFIELKEFDAKLYEVDNPSYKKVGSADVKRVELKVYKGLIYEIIVTTPINPNIMRGLEKLYGKSRFDLRTETYNWKIPDVISLAYKGIEKDKEITLKYKSYPMIKTMYADKQKKVDEIADDF
jgi:hypothetical protein